MTSHLLRARTWRSSGGSVDAASSLTATAGRDFHVVTTWVNQLASDPALVNSVEWQRVQEAHDRWSYHQRGVGPVTALVVSVVAAYAAAPMAAQAGAARSRWAPGGPVPQPDR